MISDPHLAACAQSLETSKERFEQLVVGITAQQAAWRPAPDTWSVIECFEHLAVSAEQYLDRLGPALAVARARQHTGAGPWRRRTLFGWMILRVLDPDAGRTFPAPTVFAPSPPSDLELADVRERFRSGLEGLLDLALQADGLDLDRIRLATPISRWPRITAAEAFRIHALHFPRHLDQAERVMRLPDYPA